MKKNILALGADIKNRFLVAQGKNIYFGPDIGNLSDAKNYELFKRKIHELVKDIRLDIIVHDLHPAYFSTRFAKEYSLHSKTRCIYAAQHHKSHIGSVIQESRLEKPVIGVALDGTGFGEDGRIWGGEFFIVDKKRFTRIAHLKYQMMPGGEKVIYEPWRMVLSVLKDKAIPILNRNVKKEDIDLVSIMMEKGINSPLTSSAGRLFDAAGALIAKCLYASYEAEGPIKLEKICDTSIADCYEFDIEREKGRYIINPKKIFSGIIRDLKRKVPKGVIASRFHNSMAEIVVKVVAMVSKEAFIEDVVLSGGVFQNRFLTARIIKKFLPMGFNVYINRKYPVNDLNISLGQYWMVKNRR